MLKYLGTSTLQEKQECVKCSKTAWLLQKIQIKGVKVIHGKAIGGSGRLILKLTAFKDFMVYL